jgi:hypothetical protein
MIPAAVAAAGIVGCSGSLGGLNETKVQTKWKESPARHLSPDQAVTDAPERDGSKSEAKKPQPDRKQEPDREAKPSTVGRVAVMIGPQVLLAAPAGDALVSRAAVLALAPAQAPAPTLAANVVFLPKIEEMTP